MPEVMSVIQLLVAPVVMISACGLLCLALFNRLAGIVSRARAFHKERFDAGATLAGENATSSQGAVHQRLRQRIQVLDEQVDHILRRARLVRNALILLLSSILCMLGCSLALGLALFFAWSATLALVLFIGGVLVMMAAMVLGILELRRALDPVVLEAATVAPVENL